jgi:hypothetical protein
MQEINHDILHIINHDQLQFPVNKQNTNKKVKLSP